MRSYVSANICLIYIWESMYSACIMFANKFRCVFTAEEAFDKPNRNFDASDLERVAQNKKII